MKENFVLPSGLFTMVNPISLGVNYEQGIEGPLFVIGNKYFLQTPFLEKGRDKKKVYELMGVVNEVNGVMVDALIMKQVNGERGTIFSLSKRDCESLGIEYCDSLQLFPKKMPWIGLNEQIKEFNPTDISSTPLSKVDNTVRYVLLKINGFSDSTNGYVLTPTGKLVKEDEIFKRLSITSKMQLLYGINNATVEPNQRLRFRLEKPNASGLFFPYGNCISNDGSIFVSITFTKNVGKNTYDGWLGIAPNFLDGIDPQELFAISFDESGLMTVKEHAEHYFKQMMEVSAITLHNYHHTNLFENSHTSVKPKFITPNSRNIKIWIR